MPRFLKYLWWLISGRSTWREYRFRCQLKRALLDPNLGEFPNYLFPLNLWAHLEEGTPAYEAFSAELFDSASNDPVDVDDAPQKDLNDSNVREKIMKCVDDHPEILKAFEKLLEEQSSLASSQTPWRVVAIERLPFSDNSLLSFTKIIEEACDRFSAYQIALGIADAHGSEVSLVPIIDVVTVDQDKEIILKTCPAYTDLQQPPTILTVADLKSCFASLIAGREDFQVECCDLSELGSNESEVMISRVDFPVNGIGLNQAYGIFAFIYQAPAT